jgi:hypothetical protein
MKNSSIVLLAVSILAISLHPAYLRAVLVDLAVLSVVEPSIVEHQPDIVTECPRVAVLTLQIVQLFSFQNRILA